MVSSSADSALPDQRFSNKRTVRLKREIPVRGQAGCALFAGLALLAVSSLFIVGLRSGEDFGEGTFVLYAGLTVFALPGLLLTCFAVLHVWRSRTPETIVEVDNDRFQTGSSLHVRLRQPGPVELEALNLRITCTEGEHLEENSEIRCHDSIVYQQQISCCEEVLVAAGHERQFEFDVNIPREQPATGWYGNKECIWRLTVIGSVSQRPDFEHPFVFHVDPAPGEIIPDPAWRKFTGLLESAGDSFHRMSSTNPG